MRAWAILGTMLLASGAAAAASVAIEPLAPESEPIGPVWPYHTWETLTLRLQELVAAHPDIARLHSAGKSVLGFDLWVVEIADFLNADKRPLEGREVVWLDGGTHANEQLGMMLAYLWVEHLLTQYGSDPTATWIVENRHTYILPMVNPDGNHMDSRWNAHGVNINRNYPVGWGQVNERVVGNYPGPYAMSEPETRAVVDWLHKVKPDYFNSFHTGVDMMLYPVGYAEIPAKDDAIFARICQELGETDPSFCGPVYSTIYPASGIAVDTAYFDVGAVAWTYEVSREAFAYWSLEDPRIRMDRYWRGVEHAFLNVHKYGAHLSLVGLSLLDGEASAVVQAVVENDGYADLAWADVTVYLPGGEATKTSIMGLPSGERATLRFAVPRTTAAHAGELALGFEYVKRLQGEPLRSAYEVFAVEVVEGRLQIVETAGVPILDELAFSEAPVDLPSPAGVAALAVLGLSAMAIRRRSA
ncbi:MAG TPA: M14 family zinc carboxypeptidase [Candidatus Thermoplasmatota archaeon]|nr:M14 family zinc carboxypeptidase [Candidatus Thermoplasmatota archaeon]